MAETLIVYGSRYGATASTSEEIANVLRKENLTVRVVNAKNERLQDITEYELIIVGSGIQINRWTSEPEKFLQKFQKELATKKVALFVSCGSASQTSNGPEEKTKLIARARRKYLEEKAAKYNLHPVALGLFGGVYNYNKTPWWAKKAMDADRPRVEATFKAIQPGVYDTRDWDAIRGWAKELANHHLYNNIAKSQKQTKLQSV